MTTPAPTDPRVRPINPPAHNPTPRAPARKDTPHGPNTSVFLNDAGALECALDPDDSGSGPKLAGHTRADTALIYAVLVLLHHDGYLRLIGTGRCRRPAARATLPRCTYIPGHTISCDSPGSSLPTWCTTRRYPATWRSLYLNSIHFGDFDVEDAERFINNLAARDLDIDTVARRLSTHAKTTRINPNLAPSLTRARD